MRHFSLIPEGGKFIYLILYTYHMCDINFHEKISAAREEAELGNVGMMNAYLSVIEKYSNEEFSDELKDIKMLGYEEVIPIKLFHAIEEAKSGRLDKMHLDLNYAEFYAKKIDKDISNEIAKIKTIGQNVDRIKNISSFFETYLV